MIDIQPFIDMNIFLSILVIGLVAFVAWPSRKR